MMFDVSKGKINFGWVEKLKRRRIRKVKD